jgi:hypothetical protein
MTATRSTTLDDLLVLRHEFRPTPRGPIGILAGLPVRVSQERDGDGRRTLRVWIGLAIPEVSAAVRDAILSDGRTLPVKPRAVTAFDVGVAIDLPGKLSNDGEDALVAVESVVRRAAVVPGAGAAPAEDARLTVVDGFPRWMTPSEREELMAEAETAAQAYESLAPRLGLGVVAAGVGGLIIAVVWASILAYIGYQLWLVALGGGLMVAFLAVVAARRVTVPLQVAVFAFTLGGVLLGEILGMALVIRAEFGVFDLVGSARFYLAFVQEAPGDVLFALGGGLVGAVVGVKVAERPTFHREIEEH